MKKWNMVIDVSRCHDCNDCFLSDKDEFVGNDFPPYSMAQPWSGHRWMNIERKERGEYPIVQVVYRPTPCLQCDDAPCIKDSPPGALYKREDGLVIIDPEKAKGHSEIVKTCPYEVIYWNEDLQLPQKCTGCAHLMDAGWNETRCSMICPTSAIKLVLGDDAAMAERAASEGLEVLRPELGAKPRVYYKNFYRWTKVFVSGSVVFADSDECAEGALVKVTSAGVGVGETLVNNYGEFVVDGLDPGRDYSVSISAPGYSGVEIAAAPQVSVNLGHIFLRKA